MSATPHSEAHLRFGTRGSALALAQTQLAIDLLQHAYPELQAVVQVIRTEGDLDRNSPLTEIGGRGVFTNAIEREILLGRIDAAVHSAKDLPTALHADAPIIAFPDRDDPRDVLVSRHDVPLHALPDQPVIGTSSRRREALIRRLRPDAVIRPIRGNVDSRLRKAEGSEFDAIVLAAAGIARMGWADRVSEYLPIEEFVPSPGQGAIAIQARSGSAAADVLSVLDQPSVSQPVKIERAFLAAIGAGCTTPVGAIAMATDGGYRFVGMLADTSGQRTVIVDEVLARGEEQRHVADVANRLLSDVGISPAVSLWGGGRVAGERDLSGASVVVTRPRPQAGQLLSALSCRGAEALALPTIRIEPMEDNAELDAALQAAVAGEFEWIIFTSANAVDVVGNRMVSLGIAAHHLKALNVAVVGKATAAAVRALGLAVTAMPRNATGDDLAALLQQQVSPGARVLFPRSAIGREALPEALQVAGLELVVIPAYRTIPESNIDPRVIDRVRRGEIDMVTFSSPSSVHNLVALLGEDRAALDAVPAICAGPVTADAVRESGLLLGGISPEPGDMAMADTVAAHWRRRERGSLSMPPRDKPRNASAIDMEGSVE